MDPLFGVESRESNVNDDYIVYDSASSVWVDGVYVDPAKGVVILARKKDINGKVYWLVCKRFYDPATETWIDRDIKEFVHAEDKAHRHFNRSWSWTTELKESGS